MGKMTDEELSQAMDEALQGYVRSGQRVLAHIAALTAERDEAKETARICSESASALVSGLQAERDGAVRNYDAEVAARVMAEAQRNMADRDAHTLRERVEALEAEHDRETRRVNTWRERAETAESRLVAIRQRAGDVDARWDAFRSGGDDSDGVHAVAHYILGDDAPAPPEATCPHCARTTNGRDVHLCTRAGTAAPSEWDRLQGEMAEVTEQGPTCDACHERGDFERLCCQGPRQKIAREPTTAEAFATVRDAVKGINRVTVDEGLRLLSLLERRIGAQERVIRREADVAERADLLGFAARLRAALTDAPPVFTLEEVEKACMDTWDDHGGTRATLSRLTALRRKP